jgi:hypothetical protein
LRSSDACIRDMADMVLSDDHKLVLAKIMNDPILSMVEAKRALLSGALKAFVGVHESKKLEHLGISEKELQEAGSSDDTLASFWLHDAPSDCFPQAGGHSCYVRKAIINSCEAPMELIW